MPSSKPATGNEALDKKLQGLIDSITQRNEKVQEKKSSSNPVSWVVGVILALVSLVGISVALWLASRRGKELAQLKTQVEVQRIEKLQDQARAKKEASAAVRRELDVKYRKTLQEIETQAIKINAAIKLHEERAKKIEGLKGWGPIVEE